MASKSAVEIMKIRASEAQVDQLAEISRKLDLLLGYLRLHDANGVITPTEAVRVDLAAAASSRPVAVEAEAAPEPDPEPDPEPEPSPPPARGHAPSHHGRKPS